MQVSVIPLLHFQPIFLQAESTTKSKTLYTHTHTQKKKSTQTQLTITGTQPEGTVILSFLKKCGNKFHLRRNGWCVCMCLHFKHTMCIYVLMNMCISTFMLYSIYCHRVCLDIKLHHHYYLYEQNSLCVLAFSVSSDHRWTVTVYHSLCSCTSAVSLLQLLFF